eukprot:m.1548244 g.1548244  ORF g.1548244 m.1548244 type:complete len:53 (-) comp25263_c0_seq16:2779-2937(-)
MNTPIAITAVTKFAIVIVALLILQHARKQLQRLRQSSLYTKSSNKLFPDENV